MLFDTHCHLDDPRLAPRLPLLLEEAARAGIGRFVIPGVAPEGWPGIRELAQAFPAVHPAYGIHPMHAERCDASTLERLEAFALDAVAVGEIGLDYLIPVPREVQCRAFRAQLRIAVAHGLPVLLHCRKAFGDLLGILRQEGVPLVGGVMHAFSGSRESADECLKLGLHISVCGTVTYPNTVRPLAVAAAVPIERLLIETDAPDLAPFPYRGEINLPCYLPHTARKIAEIRGISPAELARHTSANALRLFKISGERR